MKSPTLLTVVACTLLHAASTVHAQTLPDGEVEALLEPVIPTGLGGVVLLNVQNARFQYIPIDVASLGDGRHLILSISGHIRLLRADDTLAPGAYLDMRDPNRMPVEFDYTEIGNISIVAHPGFLDPASRGFGKFYTLNSEELLATETPDFDDGVSSSFDNVVYEWSIIDPAANINQEAFTFRGANPTITRREVLRSRRPSIIHTMGDMAFTPDEYLLISSGDGSFPSAAPGSGTQSATQAALNPRSIFGTMLRIDPLDLPGTDTRPQGASGEYRIHPSNFGVTDSDPLTPGEVMLYGLRSPFRISVDQPTGDIYIGDVGQSDREEIDRVVLDGSGAPIENGQSGVNYGWGRFEGTRFNTNISNAIGGRPFSEPLYELLRSTTPVEATNIVGGFVYRGSDFPELVGKYVFADTGENDEGAPSNTIDIYYGDPSSTNASTRDDVERMQLVLMPGFALPDRIWSLAESVDQEILVLVGPRRGADATAPFRDDPTGTPGGLYRLAPTCPSGLGGSECASADPFGTGCPGSNGLMAELSSPPSNLPIPGNPWTLNVGNLSASSQAFLALSFTAGPPLDLGVVGAPGCLLRTNSPTVLPLPPSVGGTTSINLNVPSVSSLVGLTSTAQAIVQDPPANQLGLVVSNALLATFGLR